MNEAEKKKAAALRKAKSRKKHSDKIDICVSISTQGKDELARLVTKYDLPQNKLLDWVIRDFEYNGRVRGRELLEKHEGDTEKASAEIDSELKAEFPGWYQKSGLAKYALADKRRSSVGNGISPPKEKKGTSI